MLLLLKSIPTLKHMFSFSQLLLVTRPRESITCTDGLVVHGPLHADTKSVGSLMYAIYIKQSSLMFFVRW